MSKISVSQFLEFINKAYGYYWFGTFGQMASLALYEEKKKQYPSSYTASDFKSQIANPKPCYDCAGLVKSLFVYPKYNAAYDLGATGIYGKCTVKGSLSSEAQLKPGYLVFKGNDKTKNHVGVYLGNGKVKEAKGHAYGVITSNLNDNNWKYWAEYYAVDYSEQPKPEPIPDNTVNVSEYPVELEVNTKFDDLMLREGPGTNYPIICRMKKGSRVIWSGDYKVDWYKVNFKTMTGYAHSDYLKIV